MYDVSGFTIAVVLLVTLVLAIEGGQRIGRRVAAGAGEGFRSHVNGIAASLIGILALLLGFTFSIALQRYDARSNAVVAEANAIGTTWLRAQLLPDPQRAEVQKSLREYIDVRTQAVSGRADAAQRAEWAVRAARLQGALWVQAVEATSRGPQPATTGLFVQGLNDLIDSNGRLEAEFARHVPEEVLLLVYAAFLLAGAVVGYSAGVSAHRASFATYGMVLLIVVLVFVILDLDRPRRGFIEVSPKSMLELQASMRADAGVPSLPASKPQTK